ncbi:hypothetical protein SLS58_006635 [Diplodia intermedia]|uniref:BTB domain-containing protein n=1 Tax=Diplodia intermedia TaxID=856260 RepID=A0ABR3TN57_9PEZI
MADDDADTAHKSKKRRTQSPTTGIDPETMITDIDPEGDVLFYFEQPGEGEDTTIRHFALRVCSKVMKLSSPVFRAMLGPHFREGQNLSQATTEEPTIIPLPDDDFASMKIICEALHYKETVLPANWITFAGLVDKYDMKDTMRFTSEAWLADELCKKGPSDKLWYQEHPEELVLAAHLLDTPRAFRTASLALMRRHNTHYLDLAPLLLEEHPLPYSVLVPLLDGSGSESQ